MSADDEWWRATLLLGAEDGRIWQQVEGYDELRDNLQFWAHRHKPALSEAEVADLAGRIAATQAFQNPALRSEFLRLVGPQQIDNADALDRLLDLLWQHPGDTDALQPVEDWITSHLLPIFPRRLLVELLTLFTRIAQTSLSIEVLSHYYDLARGGWGLSVAPSASTIQLWLDAARYKLSHLQIRDIANSHRLLKVVKRYG